jgi:hypothetical protein
MIKSWEVREWEMKGKEIENGKGKYTRNHEENHERWEPGWKVVGESWKARGWLKRWRRYSTAKVW